MVESDLPTREDPADKGIVSRSHSSSFALGVLGVESVLWNGLQGEFRCGLWRREGGIGMLTSFPAQRRRIDVARPRSRFGLLGEVTPECDGLGGDPEDRGKNDFWDMN